MAASLAEVLNDPNYQNANAATKRAIFDRYAPQDPNYTNANSATQAAIRARFGLQEVEQSTKPPERTLGGTLLEGATNIPASFAHTLGGLAEMVTSPRQTLKGLTNLVEGGVRKVLPKGANDFLTRLEQASPLEADRLASSPEGQRQITATADAMGSFYKDRYGSKQGFYNALATDPVSVALDVSTVATGAAGGLRAAGRSAAAAGSRAATSLLRAADVYSTVSKYTDPISPVLGAAAYAGSALPRFVVKHTQNFFEPFTEAGRESIKARAFMDSMQNNPELVQKAMELASQGYTPEQVASIMQNTGLAALIKTSRQADTATGTLFRQRKVDELQPRANMLAIGATQQEQAATQAGNALNQETAALTQQQQQALLVQRTEQARALAAQRQATQGQVTGLGQQQASDLLAAQTEAERRAAEVAAQARQQQAGIAAEQQALAGSIPEKSQLEVGETVTGRRAAVKADVQEKVVTPAYEAAFKLAPEEFAVPTTLQTATDIRAGTRTKLDPDLAPKTSETLRVFGDVAETRVNPLTGEKYTVTVPRKVTLRQADALIKSINQDYGALKNSVAPGANIARNNLQELKAAVEADIKGGISEEAAAAYQTARDTANARVIQPFNKGWMANLEREGATGVQMQAPEDVVKTILSGQDEANRFVRALGKDEAAMSAVRAGILDAYRNEVIRNGVIRPNAHELFMSNTKYGRALKALDDAGMGIRNELNAFGEKSRALLDRNGAVKAGTRQQVDAINAEFTARQEQVRQQTRDAIAAAKEAGAAGKAAIQESGATTRAGILDSFKTRIAELETQYKPSIEQSRAAQAEAERLLTQMRASPYNVTPQMAREHLEQLAQQNPDLRPVIDEARAFLEHEANFRARAAEGEAQGGGVRSLATDAQGKPVIPWIRGFNSSVVNFVMARIGKQINPKLAAEIAMSTINSTAFGEALQNALTKSGRGKLGTYARTPTPTPNFPAIRGRVGAANALQNALSPPTQNALAEP